MKEDLKVWLALPDAVGHSLSRGSRKSAAAAG